MKTTARFVIGASLGLTLALVGVPTALSCMPDEPEPECFWDEDLQQWICCNENMCWSYEGTADARPSGLPV